MVKFSKHDIANSYGVELQSLLDTLQVPDRNACTTDIDCYYKSLVSKLLRKQYQNNDLKNM